MAHGQDGAPKSNEARDRPRKHRHGARRPRHRSDMEAGNGTALVPDCDRGAGFTRMLARREARDEELGDLRVSAGRRPLRPTIVASVRATLRSATAAFWSVAAARAAAAIAAATTLMT